ncbi:uncharacterized protein PFL1_01926 [Pseudozyma flocculosa PF-1]|uniref:Succinate dehydrogenase assembly factor 4, mitochondrial n=1 Tax=Pseudozyma flocculosa TaxID=84751 RepID=A0A5C3F075_9BASI|nr:uncharacterized protein PFL1_01926 [Pseudozyma flocculosa PF-1]EPQ30400.1 hypothetical protein PFL1_01926 [Pseudozyma flocculosa PF-1]SPO37475.1 uncharacterized protein PSFLO_02950 [Pseudozyma flocculosa]
MLPRTLTLAARTMPSSTLAMTRSTVATRRALSTTRCASSGKFDRPGPPPLPAKEQREFERLVKDKQNSLQFTSAEEQFHPDARKKPQPDFEGETNPVTGEVGGPKKDPLTYEKEWTYGGRATDF